MTEHERYEVFCALAANGQLDAAEEADFDEHRRQCTACRDRLRELKAISVQLQWNAVLLSPSTSPSTSMPAGSLERFRSRVIHEGIAPRPASATTCATTFATCARSAAAALFVVVASLVFMAHGRKMAERSFVHNGASAASGQSLAASVERWTPVQDLSAPRLSTPRPSELVRARFVRHSRPRLTGTGARDASLTAQRFPQVLVPQVLAVGYPYFGPQVGTKLEVSDYPALSGVQISRLDLFRAFGESATRDAAGKASHVRPIDIASTGTVFDFAAQIRQLHFQLPTAQ